MEYKALPLGGIEVDDETGLVKALVAVTGVVDEVKDIIEPGAFTKTLANRTPKGVWSHDWDTPVSRTEEVKELMPGDPDLPSTTRDGKPWPSDAGALMVKARFNLETQRGREAFSDVKFFGPEAAWSIGYNVPVGGAVIEGKSGVRRIKTLDVYEYSPVLHGAMPLAATLSVKSAQAAFAAVRDTLEEKELSEESFEPVELDDEEVEVEDVETPDDAAFEAEVDQEEADLKAGDGEKGANDLDRSPDSNWVEDNGGLPRYIEKIAKSLHRKRGMTISRAIATAVSTVKRWASGQQDVNADTRAKAAAAVAEWEAMRGKAKAKKAAKLAADAAKAAHVAGLETKELGDLTALEAKVAEVLKDVDDPEDAFEAVYQFAVDEGFEEDAALDLAEDAVDKLAAQAPALAGKSLAIDDTLPPDEAGRLAAQDLEWELKRDLAPELKERIATSVKTLLEAIDEATIDEAAAIEEAGGADTISEVELMELELLRLELDT